jgi:putative acetyltransferase
MIIRTERPADFDAIRGVHEASFPTTAEARLVAMLRASERLIISLVAEIDGTVVGHVAFSPVTTQGGAVGAGLAPVAVLELHRRRGIAAGLISAGLAECRLLGFGWAVVLGDPQYYSRFCFRPAAEFGLIDEFGGGAAFQAMELSPGSIPVGAGLVRYAPEFDAFK